MKQTLYLSALAGLMTVALTGCMDNDYDLSDIDTTSEFQLTNLVLPMNVQAITLGNIIKPEDDSVLKEVTIDGKKVYAVIKTGEFNSQALKIKDINPEIPQITPTKADFDLISVTGSHTFELVSVPPQELAYSADNVDDYIVSLSEIFMEKEPSTLTLAFALEGAAAAGLTYELNDVVIDLPDGLQVTNLPAGYKFDSPTGVLKVDHLSCPDGKGEISLSVTGMKMTDETQFAGGRLNYKSYIDFSSAKLTVNSSTTSTIPQRLSFNIITTLTSLHITAFSGTVHYKLDSEDMNIPPVEISDIPAFLAQNNTHIKLANPQIYIGVENNPVAEYGLGFRSGLRLTKDFSGTKTSYEPTKPIETDSKYGAGPYNFVLSPTDPKTYPADFAKNIVHDPFPGMSEILYGNGLPYAIEVNLLNPEIPAKEIKHFRLEDYPPMHGQYEFLAPLAFKEEGTVIEYSETYDDWGSEDLDKLTVKELTVTADAINGTPLDAVLHMTPLADEIENLQVSQITLKGGNKAQPIELKVTGDIRKLKGMKLSAIVNPASEDAISPDQTITLTNVKAKVTGSYVTDF